MELSAEHFEKFIRGLEKIDGLDEKIDVIVDDIKAKQNDQESRIRSLEVFRNWSAGVGAALASVIAILKGAGKSLSDFI